MTETTKIEEKTKKSSGDDDENINEAFIPDESEKTDGLSKSNNRRRLIMLIAYFKDNSRWLLTIVLLSTLLIISFSFNIHYYCKQVSHICFINLFSTCSINRNYSQFLTNGKFRRRCISINVQMIVKHLFIVS